MNASRSNCSSAPTATPHSNASLVDSTASFTIIYSRGYDNKICKPIAAHELMIVATSLRGYLITVSLVEFNGS